MYVSISTKSKTLIVNSRLICRKNANAASFWQQSVQKRYFSTKSIAETHPSLKHCQSSEILKQKCDQFHQIRLKPLLSHCLHPLVDLHMCKTNLTIVCRFTLENNYQQNILQTRPTTVPLTEIFSQMLTSSDRRFPLIVRYSKVKKNYHHRRQLSHDQRETHRHDARITTRVASHPRTYSTALIWI